MFINSEYIAAELLVSIPVLEVIYDSLRNTELEDSEAMLLLTVITIALVLLYTFGFAEMPDTEASTEAFIVSVIEGALLAGTTCVTCGSSAGGILSRLTGRRCES